MNENKECFADGSIPKRITSSTEYESAIRKGIPAKYREQFWQVFTGNFSLMDMVKGIYYSVLEDNKGKTSEATIQIDKDVDRTFPGQKGAFDPESLRRVLVAYSWKNPEVGYCQVIIKNCI